MKADVPVRLRHSDMLRALEFIDLLDVVARELTRRAAGAVDRPRACRFIQDFGGAGAGELAVVEDLDTGHACLMPAPSLQMICLAGLTGLATRELLRRGVVTAAVFGSRTVAQLHLGVLARHLPNVSHATVHPASADGEQSARWSVRDELELAGIGLSGSADSRAAALGADLLVVTELGWERLDVGPLRPGVLMINATRRDLPDELLTQVDHIYVDDLGLIEHNQHRKFVRQHLAASKRPPDSIHHRRGGWHRRHRLWRSQRLIEAELGHVLTGQCNTPDIDDVTLVELFGGGSLDMWLASHIQQVAIKLGLGR